ncbi:copper resistance protein CopC [Promicromonospora thailandica]|uniref:CopC domain-containing protein n=1 Tax=Promicromonospora thailandica TaxID=765201 RepID=A0A9X2GDM2_9MICO|nr:copper resistance CopC family protein [Promicromonospora thailandica]MCP2267251.1 hypothetical protein [Promicromonospora thailandica]BFF17439.1 hypothetical protein GCM10025730_09600 [Promicromonospora thailandica]
MPRTRPVVAGLTVAVVALLATAAPASAHDKLVSSDPAPDQALDQAPETVSLTFSADVLDMGAAVVVSGSDGTDWVSAAPAIDGPTVTAVLDEGMPEAAYEIRWRVVSSDGHPITGVVPFSVGDVGEVGEAGDPVAVPSDLPDAQESTQTQVAQEDGTPWRAVLVGAGGAAVAVALLVVVQLIRRRGTADGTDSA